MKYISYVWIVIRNLIVLAIVIAIFGKADGDFERIVFSLLVLIYLSIDRSMAWNRIMSGTSILALGNEFSGIRKLLKETHISNTTLNPVFSEEEIAGRKKESEKMRREAVRLFNQLREKEKEEIKAHHETGKDKSSFEPSATLSSIAEEYSKAITRKICEEEDYKKMIKANLAVFNGRSIEEAKEGCELYRNGFWSLNEEVNKKVEEHIKKRKEYWESSWDSILKEEVDFFEEFEEIKDEDEEKKAEAEKEMDKAWTKFYIEGIFSSIIFFITLWNLIKGLHII
jgi:hypothetical protein